MIGDDRVLVSPMWNWGNYMIPAVESALNGTWKSQSYWGGLDDDMIHLSEISPLVPADFQKLIVAKEAEIKNGTFDVFWGQLKDNTGAIRQKAGEKMDDGAMLTIDWFVEGVIGSVK
jgi:basic membrane protein A